MKTKWPHESKGQNKHNAGVHFEYTVHQDLRAQRQAEAKIRQEVTAAEPVAQRLARLDRILGAGVGAKKERARLAKMVVAVTP